MVGNKWLKKRYMTALAGVKLNPDATTVVFRISRQGQLVQIKFIAVRFCLTVTQETTGLFALLTESQLTCI